MARIPQKELKDAMGELSANAYKLLMYYYSCRDGWIFIDKNIAKTINTSERQVKKFRKELVDKKYLLLLKGTVDVYFIGKLAVEKFEKGLVDIEEDTPTEPLISQETKESK